VTVPAYVTGLRTGADAHQSRAAAPLPHEGAVEDSEASIRPVYPNTSRTFYNDLFGMPQGPTIPTDESRK